MGTHHAAATRRRAEREQKERYGLRHYRVAKRCSGCGCKTYVFSPLARVCFECAVSSKRKAIT